MKRSLPTRGVVGGQARLVDKGGEVVSIFEQISGNNVNLSLFCVMFIFVGKPRLFLRVLFRILEKCFLIDLILTGTFF